MTARPAVDWRGALRVARLFGADVPDLGRAEIHAATASLRLAGERGGKLAVKRSKLPGTPAEAVRVVDRDGWAKGAAGMVESAIDSVTWSKRSTGKGRLVGLGAGIGLAVAGRNLLGQFDGFSATPTLYLIAPTIVATERAKRLVPADFRLWVAVHEQTHAVQFSAAPWLREYLLTRLAVVADDETRTGDAMADVARTRDPLALWAGPEARRALTEVVAAMTLMEGHADWVSDTVGRHAIPTAAKLRKAFPRESTGRLATMFPTLDKSAQYRNGLAFCRAVARRTGATGLATAFTSPETLPTTTELADAAAWIQRVLRS